MKWFLCLAMLVFLFNLPVSAGEVARVPWDGNAVLASRVAWQPTAVARVPWQPIGQESIARVSWEQMTIPAIGTQGCPTGRCGVQGPHGGTLPTQTESLPDPLDGKELPDDLFGGKPDPRAGKGGGSGGGNTCFRY